MKVSIKDSLQKLKEQFATRSTRAGSYSFFVTVIVLAILVTVNFALSFFPDSYTQKDLTANQLYSLSSQSKVLLGTLEDDITIYWIVTTGNEDEYLERLLHNYEDYSSHVTVEQVLTGSESGFYKFLYVRNNLQQLPDRGVRRPLPLHQL